MFKILKSNKGEGSIEATILLFSAMIVIAFALKFLPVFYYYSNLNDFADSLTRTAEISGRVGTEVTEAYNDLKSIHGIEPTIIWDVDYYEGNKIQLNDKIVVYVSGTYDLGFFTFGSIPVPIKVKADGRSEVYWK